MCSRDLVDDENDGTEADCEAEDRFAAVAEVPEHERRRQSHHNDVGQKRVRERIDERERGREDEVGRRLRRGKRRRGRTAAQRWLRLRVMENQSEILLVASGASRRRRARASPRWSRPPSTTRTSTRERGCFTRFDASRFSTCSFPASDPSRSRNRRRVYNSNAAFRRCRLEAASQRQWRVSKREGGSS